MAELSADRDLEVLLDYLRRSRGFDFTGYKRPQIAAALAVDSCCDTMIEASPANPPGRRRSGGAPVTSTTGAKRGSSVRRALTPSWTSCSVLIRRIMVWREMPSERPCIW